MSATLTAEEIDEAWETFLASDPAPTLLAIFAQAKRVPELEAEVARLTAGAVAQLDGVVEELDRYRKVAEAALSPAQMKYYLAAVGMKVEE
jgi:hypothetical protein